MTNDNVISLGTSKKRSKINEIENIISSLTILYTNLLNLISSLESESFIFEIYNKLKQIEEEIDALRSDNVLVFIKKTHGTKKRNLNDLNKDIEDLKNRFIQDYSNKFNNLNINELIKSTLMKQNYQDLICIVEERIILINSIFNEITSNFNYETILNKKDLLIESLKDLNSNIAELESSLGGLKIYLNIELGT